MNKNKNMPDTQHLTIGNYNSDSIVFTGFGRGGFYKSHPIDSWQSSELGMQILSTITTQRVDGGIHLKIKKKKLICFATGNGTRVRTFHVLVQYKH